MKCPTCVKKGLPPAYFCSQECFKKSWKLHKFVHSAMPRTSKFVDERFAGYGFTGRLRPAGLSATREVPAEIPRPDYADTGRPLSEERERSSQIRVIEGEDLENLRAACKLARQVLDLAGRAVAPGVTTDRLDEIVHNAIIEAGAYPSPLNYRGFPKSVCTSVNEVICHGIPDMRPLQEGDIVNIDVTVFYKGFHGDVNATFPVGEITDEAKRLIQTTYTALENATNAVKPGKLYRSIGGVIQSAVKQEGFSVVRSYCGHGIHELFHCSPNVPHYARNKAVGVMKPGHSFTIEPMINQGVFNDRTWPDDWTSVTKDGKLSAQFENTMIVTETGVEVLTARTEDSYKYWWME